VTGSAMAGKAATLAINAARTPRTSPRITRFP
jgi:hypothetical protein